MSPQLQSVYFKPLYCNVSPVTDNREVFKKGSVIVKEARRWAQPEIGSNKLQDGSEGKTPGPLEMVYYAEEKSQDLE